MLKPEPLLQCKECGRPFNNPHTGQPWRLSDPEISELLHQEISAMRADPAKARRFLIDGGFMTKSGKLTKKYGG